MASPLSTRMLAHMLSAVDNTPAEVDPFPHVIVSNFMPDDVYQELLALLPEDGEYEQFQYEKHKNKDGSGTRLRFRMENDWLDRLPGSGRSFWYAVRNTLGAPELKRKIFHKLSYGIAHRFGITERDVDQVHAYALPELFRERTGYRIKPHPDTRKKVVTMQISLPKDDSKREWGTEFYRRSLNPLHLLREPHGFEVVKTTPYVPNCAYAFTVLNTVSWKSWHGRSTLPSDGYIRNTILNIWYLQAAHGNQDLQITRRAA